MLTESMRPNERARIERSTTSVGDCKMLRNFIRQLIGLWPIKSRNKRLDRRIGDLLSY